MTFNDKKPAAYKRKNPRAKPSLLIKKNNKTKADKPILVLFNKPYDVLCQFTDNSTPPRATLANFISIPEVYAAGRLDRDSEGLLILTNCGKTQHQISEPKHKVGKTYWVQVEGDITDEAINALCKGVHLNDGLTQPAKAMKIDEPKVWDRTPPVRVRATIPTSWISLTITEGKNRQVRRMTAAVGFPTLRLIRAQIEQWTLDNLAPGEYKIIEL